MALRRILYLALLALLALSLSPEAPAQASDQTVSTLVIPIQGNIEPPLVAFLRRGVEEAKTAGVETIIFDVDTFGGRVDSALQITTLIGSLDDIRTIAYVTLSPEGSGVSWSAGALISFATDAIYMAPGTSMGAAAPVLAAPGRQEIGGLRLMKIITSKFGKTMMMPDRLPRIEKATICTMLGGK